MKNRAKKLTIMVIAAAMTVCVAAPAAVPAAAAPNTAFHTLAAKKGFVKKSGKWYYYKSGKKTTGLKKISGKYYYFNKSGVMQTGKQTISGATYYFKKAKDGKAPALLNKEQKISGKKWYFSSQGKGFLSVGNAKGNKAIATVLDEVKFSSGMSSKEKLEAAYNLILKIFKYSPAELPNLKNKSWIYSKAQEMVSEKEGKCYEYTAITALAAKALGFKTKVLTGTHKLNANAERYTEHSWVIVGGKYVLDSVRDDNNGKNGTQYFYRTYAQIKETEGTLYKSAKTFQL